MIGVKLEKPFEANVLNYFVLFFQLYFVWVTIETSGNSLFTSFGVRFPLEYTHAHTSLGIASLLSDCQRTMCDASNQRTRKHHTKRFDTHSQIAFRCVSLSHFFSLGRI